MRWVDSLLDDSWSASILRAEWGERGKTRYVHGCRGTGKNEGASGTARNLEYQPPSTVHVIAHVPRPLPPPPPPPVFMFVFVFVFAFAFALSVWHHLAVHSYTYKHMHLYTHPSSGPSGAGAARARARGQEGKRASVLKWMTMTRRKKGVREIGQVEDEDGGGATRRETRQGEANGGKLTRGRAGGAETKEGGGGERQEYKKGKGKGWNSNSKSNAGTHGNVE